MKNAKLVLFAMFVCAPLCMNGMESKLNDAERFDVWKNEVGLQSHEVTGKEIEASPLATERVSEKVAAEKPSLEKSTNNTAWLTARNVCLASTLACATTSGLQYYTGSKDHKLARINMTLGLTALASGALVANESRKLHADYVASLPKSLWNLVFGAAQASEANETLTVAPESLNLNDFEPKQVQGQEPATPKKDYAALFNSKNCGYAAAILGGTTASTYAVQYYDKNNSIVTSPNFARAQLTLLATTILSASAAAAQSEYPAMCWNYFVNQKKAE